MTVRTKKNSIIYPLINNTILWQLIKYNIMKNSNPKTYYNTFCI